MMTGMRGGMPWLTGPGLLGGGRFPASGPSSTIASPPSRLTPAGPSTSGGTGTATTGAAATVPGAVSAFERQLRARLQPPALPSFAIPTDLLTSAQERDISQRLRLTPG